MRPCPRCQRGQLMTLDLGEPRCINCGYVDYPDLKIAQELEQPGEGRRGPRLREGSHRWEKATA